ncbi:hypothetical protein JCM9279_007104 [Rhodotorula babjevae]
MADYWVSRDKYFCKYCKIYIADDKPSKIHHETGFRHKGNYERYIREVYRKGMTDKKDRAEEARELARVEAAAAAAMGLPPPDAPSSSSSSTKPKATASASTSSAAPDPFANYSTAAQLGYRDEAAERAAEDAAKRDEEAELRKSEGTIGQWQKVAKPVVRLPPAPAPAMGKGKGRAEDGFVGGALLGSAAAAAAAAGGIKREDADAKPDLDVKPAPLVGATEDAAEDDDADPAATTTKKRRAFLAEKSAFPDDDGALSDGADGGLPALGPIKLKKRRLTVKEQAAEAAAREAAVQEVREREERRAARDKEGARVGQWESVEVGAEGEQAPLEFEAPPVEEAQEGQAGAVAADEEAKPRAAPSGFKKRKMPGAAARRK